MRGLKLIVILVGIMSLVSSQVSWAEEEKKIIKLEDVVVTATKTEKRAIDVSAAQTIITGEEIEALGARRITDFFKYTVPSLGVEDGGYGPGRIAKMRGFRADDNQILVLIDGMPCMTYMTGGHSSNLPIPPEQIERIEVIRGPSSALYGGTAVGGVINIITKQEATGPTFKVKAGYGSYGTHSYNAEANFLTGNSGFRLIATRDEKDGWRDNSNHDKDNFMFLFNTEPDPNSILNLSVNYYKEWYEFPGPLYKDDYENHPKISYYKDKAEVEERHWRTSVLYQKELIDKIDVVTRFHLDVGDRDSWDASWGPYEYVKDFYGWGLELQTNLKYDLFGMKNTLTAGIVCEREHLDEDRFKYSGDIRGEVNRISETTLRQYAGYLQDDLWLTSRLNLVLGARYETVDFNNVVKLGHYKSASEDLDHVSPKVGITYKLTDNMSVYTSIADSFCYPKRWKWSQNPALKPTEGVNYEVGLKGIFADKISYALAVYQMDLENEVVYDYSWPERYRNVGETRHRGAEVELKYEIMNGLSLAVNYAWMDVTVEKNEAKPEYEGNKMKLCPENRVGAQISYHHPTGLFGTIAVRWEDESYIDPKNTIVLPSYWETSASVGFDWKGYSLSFVVNNLFDDKYAQKAYGSTPSKVKYYPMPPINLMVTVSAQF